MHRDDRILRGAAQASATLLSPLPFPAPLLDAAIALGPCLLDAFEDLAPQIFRDSIQIWPKPIPGRPLCLDIAPHPLSCMLPNDATLPASVPPSAPEGRRAVQGAGPLSAMLPGVFQDADLVEVFDACGAHLWPLWELVLLAEPVSVYSRDTAACSRAVLALVSMVAPMPFAADFRPVFSIQDIQVQDVLVCQCISTI
jgi:hypothetical protein